MDDLYQQIILDHYKHPQNWGQLKGKGVISSKETNSSCGDKIEVTIRLSARKKIEDIKFTGDGCAISIAATSMLTQKIKNQKSKIKDIETITIKDIENLLGIGSNPAREKCLTIGLFTIKKTLKLT